MPVNTTVFSFFLNSYVINRFCSLILYIHANHIGYYYYCQSNNEHILEEEISDSLCQKSVKLLGGYGGTESNQMTADWMADPPKIFKSFRIIQSCYLLPETQFHAECRNKLHLYSIKSYRENQQEQNNGSSPCPPPEHANVPYQVTHVSDTDYQHTFLPSF